jgi:hypothetical protein
MCPLSLLKRLVYQITAITKGIKDIRDLFLLHLLNKESNAIQLLIQIQELMLLTIAHHSKENLFQNLMLPILQRCQREHLTRDQLTGLARKLQCGMLINHKEENNFLKQIKRSIIIRSTPNLNGIELLKQELIL